MKHHTKKTEHARTHQCFEHLVQFYHDEQALMGLLSSYFKIGIENGDCFIVIATDSHLQSIKDCLGHFMDIDRAKALGKYIPLDAQKTLAEFMVKGLPDAKKFNHYVGNLVARASLHGKRVRAFGEMVALLWSQGNKDGALKLEKLWNNLSKTRDFSLLCSYPISNFYSTDEQMPFPQICTLHSNVITETKVVKI